MEDRTNLIVGVIQAAGGEIIGKIRMQKIFYLLEQLDLSANLSYSYHHFGPYSEDLSRSLDYAELIDKKIQEVPKDTPSGSTFIAYTLSEESRNSQPKRVGNFNFSDINNLIKDMTAETSIVIELAATIHWLKEKEKVEDWRHELLRRKTTKATQEFVIRAEKLLKDLKLAA